MPLLQVALAMLAANKPVNIGDHIPYVICKEVRAPCFNSVLFCSVLFCFAKRLYAVFIYDTLVFAVSLHSFLYSQNANYALYTSHIPCPTSL